MLDHDLLKTMAEIIAPLAVIVGGLIRIDSRITKLETITGYLKEEIDKILEKMQ